MLVKQPEAEWWAQRWQVVSPEQAEAWRVQAQVPAAESQVLEAESQVLVLPAQVRPLQEPVPPQGRARAPVLPPRRP